MHSYPNQYQDMKRKIVMELYSGFELATAGMEEVVCWSAREQRSLLGYLLIDHFADVSKTIVEEKLRNDR